LVSYCKSDIVLLLLGGSRIGVQGLRCRCKMLPGLLNSSQRIKLSRTRVLERERGEANTLCEMKLRPREICIWKIPLACMMRLLDQHSGEVFTSVTSESSCQHSEGRVLIQRWHDDSTMKVSKRCREDAENSVETVCLSAIVPSSPRQEPVPGTCQVSDWLRTVLRQNVTEEWPRRK
jgi:hypothetical protein